MDLTSNRGPALATLLLLGALGACTDVQGDSGNSGSGFPVGSVQTNPATGLQVVIESNKRGEASSLHLVGNPVWGRLVDIRATDPTTGFEATYFVDYLVGPHIVTTTSWVLDRNPATGKETITILADFGSPEFTSALSQFESGLQAFIDRGLGANQVPPYTALPRNGAMAFRFDDVLDDGGNPGDPGYPGTVLPSTVQVEVGYPPDQPFEARILPDPNHGDFINGTFHSTRVIIDMSVSQEESTGAGVDPNPLGLPEAVTTQSPSAVIRLPTTKDPLATQNELITNLNGSKLTFNGNGSNDPFSSTLDVVRAFRAGGPTSVTGDPYQGFLPDDTPPRLLGSQSVTVSKVQAVVGGILADFSFGTPACGVAPRIGDVLILSQFAARVLQDGGSPIGGQLTGVYCEVISGSAAGFVQGVGEYRSAWDPALGVAPECFVRFSPGAGALPSTNVSADASVIVAFDEPMAPESLSSFGGLLVSPSPPASNPMKRDVLAVVTGGLDLREFTFAPLHTLNHTQGNSETYTVEVRPAVTDLAGNPLQTLLPKTTFTIASTSPSAQSGSIQASFTEFLQLGGNSSANVDDNKDGLPEWRGQFVADPGRGRIQARAVTRFSGTADASQPIVAAMTPPLLPGTITPLSGHGCRAMMVWRYCDLGLSLTDETTFNIDVEGLAWSPVTLGASADHFNQFRMALAHSYYLPDEAVTSGLPGSPNSGLSTTFAQNLLDPVNDPLKVVHERSLGYTVQPLEQFVSPFGTFLVPWPLNRNVPVSEFNFYTWRDTTLEPLGGPLGNGADPLALPGGTTVYGGTKVPSIGLPLLMEFRTYPDSTATSVNRLQYLEANNIIFNPAQTPFFRVHSTGGALPANPTGVVVSPDQQITAQGGLDVSGQPTLPGDNAFYVGQAEFVVRVSRVHSIWFDGSVASQWAGPVVIPDASGLPSGTTISMSFRGALGITGSGYNDASNIDMYGNPTTGASFSVVYLNGDSSWKTSLVPLAGARFIQIRLTLVSNVEELIEPAVSALGLTHYN